MSEATIDRWVADPVPFAVDGCGQRQLVEWQRDELRALAYPGQVSALVWGRQIGKSLTFALLGLWAAVTKRGSRTLILSGGGESGGKRIIGEVRRIISASADLRSSVVEETSTLVRFDNGSEIRSVAASESAIRGWTVDVLLVDEAQLLSDELLLSAALPTTLARRGSFAVLAGTAGRAEGAFYDVFRQGETGVDGVYASRRVSKLVGGSDETPWLNPSMMARLESTMGAIRVDAELRGIFATGSGYLFSSSDLDAVTADYRADTIDTMRGPAGVFGGLDLAVSATGDRSAFVAVGRPVVHGADAPLFAVRCAELFRPGHPLMAPEGGTTGVFNEIAASPMVLESLRVDATGMQGGFSQYLAPLLRRRPTDLGGGRRRTGTVIVTEDPYAEPKPYRPRPPRNYDAPTPTDYRGIAFNQAMKEAGYGALRMLVQGQQLLIPASAIETRRQLLALKVGLSRSGNETFEAQSGSHDDLPDALILALRPYRRKGDGAWRTIVGDLANRPGPAAGPPGTGDTVLTGAGLRVPRRPTWAGMRTDGMTLSEDAQPAPRGPDRASLARTMAALDALSTTNTKGRG